MSNHQSSNCHVEPLQKSVDATELADAMTAYLAVQGMGCPRCAIRVNNGLLGLDGVLLSNVVLEEAAAVVVYDPHRAAPDDLLQAVVAAGHAGRHDYQAQFAGQIPYRDLNHGA